MSLKRLKIHEFHTTIRYLEQPPIPWPAVFKLCGRLEREAVKDFAKTSGQILLMYLVATSLATEERIQLEIASYTIGLASEYFYALLAFLIFQGTIQFNHLSTAMSLKIRVSARLLLNGFSATTYDVIDGGNRVGFAIPSVRNSYIVERLPVSNLLGYFVLTAVFIGLLPILLVSVFVATELFQLVSTSRGSLLQFSTGAIGVFLIVASILNLVLFHLPLPVKKNTFSIRWGILYRLPTHNSDHAKFTRWQDDEKSRR